MRRRQWVREGDLIIVWPWDFQDSKADVNIDTPKHKPCICQERASYQTMLMSLA